MQTEDPENGIYVMPIDADDLFSCRISEYVNKHKGAHGFVSDYGYVYHKGKNFLEKYYEMHTFCGSCNIIKMYPNDLPDNMPDQSLCFDKETAGILNERYPIRWNHNEVVEKYKKLGKHFEKLPFPSTIYCLGNGENISSWNNNKDNYIGYKQKVRNILSRIKHYPSNFKLRVKINSKTISEFSVTKNDLKY